MLDVADRGTPGLVAVRILRTVAGRWGGLWHPGEVAGFPPDVADDLVERGAAERLDGDSTEPVEARAPDGPPADKMVRAQEVARKAR